MTSSNDKNSFFTATWVIVLGSVISCALWGSAAPCIKIGYGLFAVNTAHVFSMWLFAGLRFTLAGILVFIAASIMAKKPVVPKKQDLPVILMLAATQTAIQYFCYYIGVANASGVNVSLCNGTGPFLSVLVSCLLFRLEKFTPQKIVGCILGFAGVALVALDGAKNGVAGFSFLGEGMVVISALSSAIAASLANRHTKHIDPLLLCSWQFMLGGSFMILVSLLGGGHVSWPGIKGLTLLLYMGFISSAAFGIRMTLLKYNNVSRVTVYNFLTPVFGVFMSAAILKEDAFRPMMIAALVLVVAGISIVNKKK